MLKKIIFTAVLVLIAAGSFLFGVLTFGSSPDKGNIIVTAPDTEAGEDNQITGEIENLTEVRQRGPIISFLLPDINAEVGIQKELTRKSREVLGVWATLKIINGVINILQSAQVGGSFFVEASINPLEFLSPVDNVLDKLSDMLLWAFAAIMFEKILLAVSGYLVFMIVIPLCAIITIITVWTYKDKQKVHRVIIVSVIISLIIPLAIPISFQLSSLMENKLLTNNVERVLTSIKEKGETAGEMETEVTGLRRVGNSIMAFMNTAKDLGNALIEDMINYFIIFIFTNIVIPITTILGLFFLTKYLAKLILTV
ncbi:MAG: hypothetical protein FWC21_07145 [Treponema sp.]|nr:hypothetical protein [Treponema sp.]